MTTTKEANSHDDYIAIDRAVYAVDCESGDPECYVDMYWCCGLDNRTRVQVRILMGAESGMATVSFSAVRMDFIDTPDGIMQTGESPLVSSGWIEVGKQRASSTRASTSEGDRCAVAEMSDDVAIALLQSLAHGSLPTVGIQFAGEPTMQVFRIMDPMPRAQSIELRMMEMPRTPIRLDSTAQMPPEILRYLLQFDSVFSACEYFEQVLKNRYLAEIAEELDRLCVRNGIIGYHFTRATREDIAGRGLEVASGARRRSDFLATCGHLFSAAQRERIGQMWDYFDARQNRARDGRIYFTFTLDALSNGGAHPLLTYFGGEVVNMPLTNDEEIAAILQTIGESLVIECELEPEKLRASCENPWGSTWLSSYHVAVNPRAHRHAAEAHLLEPLLPSNLVGIRIAQPCGTKNWRI